MYKKTLAFILSASLCMSAVSPVLAAETMPEEGTPAITQEIAEDAPDSGGAADEAAQPEEAEAVQETADDADAEHEEAYEEPAQEEDMNEPEAAVPSKVTITLYPDQDLAFADEEIEPFLIVKCDGKTIYDDEYSVTFTNNVNVGTANAHVTGTGRYEFEKDFTFEITPRELTEENVITTMKKYENRYNMHAYGTNKVYVSYGTRFLTKGTEYTITGENAFNESGGKATITGVGNFTGTVTVQCPEWDPISIDIDGDFVYGVTPEPVTTVKIGDKVLTRGEKEGDGDYYVTTTFTGDRTLEVAVNGTYEGAEIYDYKVFGVNKFTLTSKNVTLSQTSYKYTGDYIKPEPTVKANGNTLVKEKDYTLSYKNNVSKGTATVTVHGMGNYDGTVEKQFAITAEDPGPQTPSEFTAELKDSTAITYDGTEKKPEYIVKADGVTVPASAYTVQYKNNTNAGTATATITGTYSGADFTLTKKFTIKKQAIAGKNVTLSPSSYEYTGSAIEPKPVVKAGSKTLSEGTDYTLSYENNIEKGTASVTVQGKGNYSGTITKQFTITKASSFTAELKDSTAITYDGTAKKPEYVVKADGATVPAGSYTVQYKNNTNAGTATATISGTYNGESFSLTQTFTIGRQALLSKNITLSPLYYTYTGSAIEPKPTVKAGSKTLSEGTDYTLSYSANVEAGTASAIVQGKGNYSGKITKKFTIIMVTAELKDSTAVTYDGTAKKPEYVVKADGEEVPADEYTVQYRNNTNAGTATAVISGSYNGAEFSLTQTFTIGRQALLSKNVTLGASTYEYTGSAIKPEPTVKAGSKTLVKDTDYTLTYSNNVEAGTASVTVQGKGNYSGKITKKFTITKEEGQSKTIDSVTLNPSSAEYTGSEITPAVTAKSGSTTLKSGTDYTVSYSDNVNAGMGKVTVTGKGAYAGSTVTKMFKISPKEISFSISPVKSKFTYDGKAHRPGVTKQTDAEVPDSAFDVTYSGNGTDAGEYTITVTPKGNYTGTPATAVYVIEPKKVTPVVTVSSPRLTYNGNVRTPGVSVKVNGEKIPASNYTVKYAGVRRNVAEYAITVTMKGNYSGTGSTSFTIIPQKTEIKSLEAVKGKNAFIVRWKKQNVQTSGYQIQYSTDKNFTKDLHTITFKGADLTSRTIIGIKAKTFYYVRIRAYRQLGKTKIYSLWGY